MDKIELLSSLFLGNSVAEYDDNLKNYFVTTSQVEEIIRDRWDIVRGAKGSGKSAIRVSLSEKKDTEPDLEDVILVEAVNHQGDPVFRQVFMSLNLPVDESSLINAWKIYIINLVWPHVKEISSNFTGLEDYLTSNKLIINQPTLLQRLSFAIARVFTPQKFSLTLQDPNGFSFRYEGEVVLCNPESEPVTGIDFNYIFETLNSLLGESRLWVLMDRLDDAFPDNQELEVLALKSLLYAYKDIAGLSSLKLKIFLRDDVYERITVDGFRSLTHVNANAMPPIYWTEDKLIHLVAERFLFNDSFKTYLLEQGYNPEDIKTTDDRKLLMLIIFRDQVDIGSKNPPTIGWIINHVVDGKGVATPRDVISLIDKARQYQIEQWSMNKINDDENYLISPTALKRALTTVSGDKLNTQVYAEYPNLRLHIEQFRNGKAEHDENSLQILFGSEWAKIVEQLISIGLITSLTSSWKIPFLYRDALNVTQGKAQI